MRKYFIIIMGTIMGVQIISNIYNKNNRIDAISGLGYNGYTKLLEDFYKEQE